MTRPRLTILAASILTLAATARVEVAPASEVSLASQGALFLGFEAGEERRYVLGPAEQLHPGEGGDWSIYLRELVGNPPEGIFELAHH
ncbi:MAG: hypothetical protein PVJ51_11600, partial [Acidobacteriota bacterium]